MQINPTHILTVSAGRKNLVNFNFFKWYLNMDFTGVACFADYVNLFVKILKFRNVNVTHEYIFIQLDKL